MKSFTKMIAAAAVAAIALAGCASNPGASPDTEPSPGKSTDVTILLNWYPTGAHAPFYYGVEEGIFKKHGINLTVQAGQGAGKSVLAVGGGQVDFGWADSAALLASVDKGVAVKSVGVFTQTNPAAVISFESSGIKTPKDLAGKKIATTSGDAPTLVFPEYLKAAGLSNDDTTQQNLDAAGKVSALISGQVDGLIGFVTDQGIAIAEKTGKEVSTMTYADAGLNYFGNSLIASDKMIKENPALVKAMTEATSEAFQAAEKDPEAAVKSMEGKDPQLPSQKVLLEGWNKTIELMHTENSKSLAPGVTVKADWESTIKLLQSAGVVAAAKTPETYMDASFLPAK